MNIVTLSVASQKTFEHRVKAAFAGEAQGNRISFATPELLWRTLTAERWEILKAMAGQGGLTIREVARRVGRDVEAVHGDIHALLSAGIRPGRGRKSGLPLRCGACRFRAEDGVKSAAQGCG